MSVNLFYNYYTPLNPVRASEVHACLAVAIGDKNIDRIVLIGGAHEWQSMSTSKLIPWDHPGRPLIADYFRCASEVSADDDVNIIINSDCFVDPRTTPKVSRIRSGEAYCISRHELATLIPLQIDYQTKKDVARLRHVMQDCWVFRGKPREGMWLQYTLGQAGCDNRLAYELQKVGYRILDPFFSVRVVHFHNSEERTYSESNRVPQPYAFPKPHGRAAHYLRIKLLPYRIRNALQRMCGRESDSIVPPQSGDSG